MLEAIGTVVRRARLGRKAPRYCEACGQSTREGKPYCVAHLFRNWYARELRDRILANELEAAMVKAEGSRFVDVKGDNACDVLAELFEAPQSVGELRMRLKERDPRKPGIESDAYLEALAAAGLIVLSLARGTGGRVITFAERVDMINARCA